MSLAQSPSIVTNGLVLYYDMANTKKSFKGAPTTNMLYNGDGQGATTGVPTDWGLDQPFGGISLSNNTSGRDSNGRGYYQFTISGTTTVGNRLLISPSRGYPGETVTAGASYSFSYGVSLAAGYYPYNIQINLLWYDSANTYLSASFGNVITPTNSYQRDTFTATAPANAAKCRTRFDFVGYGTIGTSVNFTMRLYECQLELGSFATAYIPTTTAPVTRSNTQTIMDLTGLNTITANSLTYASDNTFSFNGTGDYLTIPFNAGSFTFNSEQTILLWLKNTAGSALRRNPYGQAYGGGGTITQETNNYFTYYWGTSGVNSSPWLQLGTNFAVNVGETAMIGVTRSPTGIYWYKNGVMTNSTGNSYGSTVVTGTLPITIGSSYTNFFSGNVYQVLLYNRFLSAAEVAQNFNAVRARYGI